MPLAAKVNVFNTQIGGDQKLMAGGNSEDGAVIANAADQGPAANPPGQWPGQSLDVFDQLSFG
jgi:hypothetical protein